MMKCFRLLFLLSVIFFANPLYAQNTGSHRKWKQLNKEGVAYFETGNFTKAEPLFLEAKEMLTPKDANYRVSLRNLGIVYFEMGNYTKAEPLLLEAKEMWTREDANYASTLIALGRVYTNLYNYRKAEPLLLEAREIRSKVHNKKGDVQYANAVYWLANLYVMRGSYSNAELLILESLELYAKALGKENMTYAATLFNLADYYFTSGQYTKAEPLLLESKEISSRVLGKSNPHSSICLNLLGELYRERGNYPRAELLHLEAIEEYAKLKGKENERYAYFVYTLGRLHADMGNYGKAELLYLESAEIMAKVTGKENPAYWVRLADLGLLYFQMGNYGKAEKLYLEAKENVERILGKENTYYGKVLNYLASFYDEIGDYPKAESYHQEGVVLTRKLHGVSHPNYAMALNNLAKHYHVLGNYSKSEPMFQVSNEIAAKALGKANFKYAIILNNQAGLYTDMKDYPKAEALLLESQEISANILGKENPIYAAVSSNLAKIYIQTDNYSKAEPLLLEANKIIANNPGKNHIFYAASLNLLAMLYDKMGNYSRAELLWLEASDVFARVLNKEHPEYPLLLSRLAKIYTEMGNTSKAAPLYLESASRTYQQIVLNFPSLSEKEKQEYYLRIKEPIQDFGAFCLEHYNQNQGIVIDLYRLILATKGMLFNASDKARQRILSSNDTLLIATYNDWRFKKNFLAKVYQMSIVEKQQRGIDEKLLEEEANTLEKSLNQKSELFATEMDQKQYNWGDVLLKLKPGEAAIEMVKTTKRINNVEVAVYAALIVTSQTKIHPDLVIIENGNDLDEKFSKHYRNAITQKVKDEISYNQYWKPIAERLKGVKKVYVSADGVYNQINLNTLFNPATGKYVLDEMEVQMVTSTKDLVTDKNRANSKINSTTLFGYPNYNNSKPSRLDSSRSVLFASIPQADDIKSDSSQRFFDGANISELPGTKVEVETIGALLKNKSISVYEYLFDASTESEVKRLNNPQVLHIATHGFFLSDLKEPDESGRGFAGMEIRKFMENPLLRSGLLFAGVKDAFAKKEGSSDSNTEDGILTAYEAMNLDLDQTDLVVMSACETGLGVTRNGEGVYGLQRAFQVAGAKSVLMSLWRVSDEATQQLMTSFYEKWLAGNTPRAAFRKAQLSLREKYPEPYYWGAFVLVGQ